MGKLYEIFKFDVSLIGSIIIVIANYLRSLRQLIYFSSEIVHLPGGIFMITLQAHAENELTV